VSGGGTGGHVYPALTVLDILRVTKPANSPLPTLTADNMLWIGSHGGLEAKLVERAGLEFVGLSAGGLRGVGVLVSIRNALRIIGSLGQAQRVLGRFDPSAVLVTGGYACVSVTLAAWLRAVPVLIYLPDIVPGLAVRFLSRFAAKIAVTSEESYRYFPREKVVVSGYPVRADVYTMTREQAQQDLNLNAADKTLLVFGGSRGARSINQALVAGLETLLPVCQIVHITGKLDADWVAGIAKRLPEDLRARYHQYTYLHNMAPALVAADLVVARAGAATMGEFPAAGLPALLVPYPHSGQHQNPNAEYMAENGAAQILPDSELEEKLASTVLDLFSDPDSLQGMQESTRAMARQDAAATIAEHLWLMARQRAARSSPPSMGDGEKNRTHP
jgi:UDP-N-acetylglucosamine--N-acetylmuramyl-(pentapeptide) pyrophosphoryl-undecaprenol N-acetylglucosamine transferase